MFDVEIRLVVPGDFLNTEAFTTHMADSMPAIAREGRDYWRTLAGQRLKASRNEYQRTVKVFDKTSTGITLGLEGNRWIMGLETGSDEYELHPNTPYGKTIPLNWHWNKKTNAPDRLIYPERSTNVKFVKKVRKWKHPGFEGMNMRDDVIEHLTSEIIPKYIEEAMAKCLGQK